MGSRKLNVREQRVGNDTALLDLLEAIVVVPATARHAVRGAEVGISLREVEQLAQLDRRHRFDKSRTAERNARTAHTGLHRGDVVTTVVPPVDGGSEARDRRRAVSSSRSCGERLIVGMMSLPSSARFSSSESNECGV